MHRFRTQTWKQNVAANFGAAVQSYDGYSTIQSHAAGVLAGLCAGRDVRAILELGCGTGALTRLLLETYGEDVGFCVTDLSSAMLAQARTSLYGLKSKVFWQAVDAERFVSDRKYDLIAANMVFQWFSDPDATLERLSGFLEPGGRILFSMPGPASFPEWRSVLSELGLPSGLLSFQPPGAARILKEERQVVLCPGALDFLRGLKKTGAHGARAGYDPLSAGHLVRACRLFDTGFGGSGNGTMTWHILYGVYEA